MRRSCASRSPLSNPYLTPILPLSNTYLTTTHHAKVLCFSQSMHTLEFLEMVLATSQWGQVRGVKYGWTCLDHPYDPSFTPLRHHSMGRCVV